MAGSTSFSATSPPVLNEDDGNKPIVGAQSETNAPDSNDPEAYVEQIGKYAPFDWSDEPFVKCDGRQKALFNSLCVNVARMDIASRYLEVSQAWEARLFNRGYQHLIPRAGGGFDLPGANSIWGPLAVGDASANYPMNVYGRDKDIIEGAMAREVPKVQFFPRNPMDAEDIAAAEAANKYKYIFEKDAGLRHILQMMAMYYYTDDRVVLYTRHVKNAARYGLDKMGLPSGSEETWVGGKLETKVPMLAQEQKDMNYVQLYFDMDITQAKGVTPWIRNRIASATHGLGELGYDYIARISTRQGLYGRIVTGDSLARTITMQYTWFRPETWYDEIIKDHERDWFFENFPDGALVCFMGQEFAFARNERLDDHIVVTHALTDVGQNRRSLGSSNIPVQKRCNNFMDLLDAFARKTIPRIWYNAQLYSQEAIELQENMPGHGSTVEQLPGTPIQETMGLEPVPQAQPFLFEMAQLYFNQIPASLTGAVQAIYGGDDNGPTPVGSQVLQRDAALGRISIPWNNAKQGICRAFEQAVMAASKTDRVMSGNGPDGAQISARTAALRGNTYAYAEYDSEIPETWRQREQRYTEIVEESGKNPVIAKMLTLPKNMRALADNIGMAELEVPGEASVRKQIDEIEKLKNSAPVPNPKFLMLEQAIQQMEAQGADPQALAQAATALSQIPKLVSSVPVAQDASEDHAVEAATCFEWMNSTEGLKFKHGLGDEVLGFQNVHIHWEQHMDMAAKLAKPEAQKPPSVSINFKDMPPEAQVQALKEAGIDVGTQQIDTDRMQRTHRKIAEKIIPKSIPETIRSVKRGPG